MADKRQRLTGQPKSDMDGEANRMSYRLLIISSRSSDRTLAANTLKLAGRRHPEYRFQLSATTEPVDAKQRLLKMRFDVVLADMDMPGGLVDLLNITKLPIILLAEHNNELRAQQAVKSGFQDYLIRDEITPRLMFRAVLHAVDRTRLSRQLQEFIDQSRNEEENLRNIINRNADAHLIVDQRGEIRFVNPAAVELFGRPADRLIGDRFRYPVAPDERFEIKIDREDGGERIVEMRMSEVQWRGSMAILACMRDITERKQSEQELGRLASFPELDPNSIIEIDLKGRVQYINPAAGKLFPDIVKKGERHPMLKGLRALVRKEMPDSKKFLAREAGVNGKVYEQHITVVPRSDRIRVYALDVTMRRRMEDALKAAKERAERASKSKTEFLANMSHEIRTPMHTILGMSDLLAAGGLDSEQLKRVRIIKTAGTTLLSIINDILDMSRVESGKMTLERIEFDLHETVEKTVEFMSIAAAEKGLALNLQIDPAVPRAVAGDPVRLRQILVNLIGNAVKFTSKGSVSVRVEHGRRLSTQTGKRGEAVFHVSDTGIGIAADKLKTIFSSFTQASSDTTRKYGGTGLGLTISKRLAEMMGGRIWVESKPGAGSTFSFTAKFDLPARAAASVSATVGATHASPLPATRQRTSKQDPARQDRPVWPFTPERPARILLVDDSPHNHMLIDAYLASIPHKLDLAQDGGAGLKKFKAGEYDLVLMDMQMPVMDGCEATRRAREWERSQRRKSTPIIALTASAMPEDRRRALDAGCHAHLTKPMDMDTFLKSIEPFLAKSARASTKAAPASSPAAIRTDTRTAATSSPATSRQSDGKAAGFSPSPRRGEGGGEGRIRVEIDAAIRHLVPGYVKDIRETFIPAMESAWNADDLTTVRDYGHKLKGTGGAYGLDNVTTLGAAIEETAERADRNATRKLLNDLENYLNNLDIVYVSER